MLQLAHLFVGFVVLDEASTWDSGKLLDLKVRAWSGKRRLYRMRTLQGHELQRTIHLPRFGQRWVSDWLDPPYLILIFFALMVREEERKLRSIEFFAPLRPSEVSRDHARLFIEEGSFYLETVCAKVQCGTKSRMKVFSF